MESNNIQSEYSALFNKIKNIHNYTYYISINNKQYPLTIIINTIVIYIEINDNNLTCLSLCVYLDKMPYISAVEQYHCFDAINIQLYFNILYTFLREFNYNGDINLQDVSEINDIPTLLIRLLRNEGSIYSRFGFNFRTNKNDNIIRIIHNFNLPFSTYTINYYINNFFSKKELYNNNTKQLLKYIKNYIIKSYDIDNIIEQYTIILNDIIANKAYVNLIKYITNVFSIFKKFRSNISYNTKINYNITHTKYNKHLNNNIKLYNRLNNNIRENIINKVNNNIQYYLDNNIFYYMNEIVCNDINTSFSIYSYIKNIKQISSSYLYIYELDSELFCDNINI